MIAEHGAHLARPGIGQDQIALRRTLENVAVGIDKRRLDTEKRLRRRTRLQRGRARQRGNGNAAGFGLPPGIDDRAIPVANHGVIPVPCLGIDRLTDRAEQAQRFAAGRFNRRVAFADQGADRRRRGIEYIYLVLVADLPETGKIRVVRHAFKDQRGRTIGERAIDDIAVAGDPADIGGAPVHIPVVIIEHVLMGHRRVDHVAAGGVQHALGLAG